MPKPTSKKRKEKSERRRRKEKKLASNELQKIYKKYLNYSPRIYRCICNYKRKSGEVGWSMNEVQIIKRMITPMKTKKKKKKKESEEEEEEEEKKMFSEEDEQKLK